MLPNEFTSYTRSLVASVLSASNFLFWKEAGYFAAANELKPLLHTWSLAVEEQYYVIFPLMLAFLIRHKKAFLGVGALTLISFGLTQALSQADPAANFYLLPSRFWELGAGALLAMVLPRLTKRRTDGAVSMVGLVLIIGSIVLVDGARPYPGWWTLPAVAGTAMVIACAGAGTLANRVLSLRPIVFIGLISYSTYLWHQPLFAFARIRLLDDVSAPTFAALIAGSLILGYLNWRYIERPFRDKNRISRRFIFTASAIGASLLVTIGAIAWALPASVRAPTSDLAALKTRMAANVGLGVCDNADAPPPVCQTSPEPEVLVWGDSFAMQLVDGLIASRPNLKIAQLTKSVCGPFLDLAPIDRPDYPASWARTCSAFNDGVKAYIERTPSLRHVIMSMRLERYLEPGAMALTGGVVTDASPDLVRAKFAETMQWIRQRGVEPVFVNPIPRDNHDPSVCVARSRWLSLDSSSCAIEKLDADRYAAQINRLEAPLNQTFRFVDLESLLCSADTCAVEDGETILYRDAHHLSKEGSSHIGAMFDFYRLFVAPGP
jgi:peptidoglycan/LPS O-acetylase OafA/YrhL